MERPLVSTRTKQEYVQAIYHRYRGASDQHSVSRVHHLSQQRQDPVTVEHAEYDEHQVEQA